MEQVSDPEPAAAAARESPPRSLFPIVAQIVLFAAFGWGLAGVAQFSAIYDDPDPFPLGPVPAVLVLNKFLESIHIPLWTLAVLGLAVDLGVWRTLRRQGRLRAADLWLCLVLAGVVLTGAIVVVSVFLPLVGDINVRR